jgi:hypothetical protein
MNAEGQQHGKAAGSVRAIDIDHDVDPVAHRHGDVFVADDPGVFRGCSELTAAGGLREKLGERVVLPSFKLNRYVGALSSPD